MVTNTKLFKSSNLPKPVFRPKRESLFRFDFSSTALSMNDYLKENNIDVRLILFNDSDSKIG